MSCWRVYSYRMKNYCVLDIFQTLWTLPKFKSPFLPDWLIFLCSVMAIPLFIQSWKLIFPSSNSPHQAEKGWCWFYWWCVSWIYHLFSSSPHKLSFFLTLDYYSRLQNLLQLYPHTTFKIIFLERGLSILFPCLKLFSILTISQKMNFLS